MAALWTIAANPRRKRRAGSRKHRTAAQRAATRRMLAANRARRGGATRVSRRRRRAAPRAIVIRSNPRRAAPARRRARRSGGSGGRASMRAYSNSLMGYLKSGAAGAGGAIAVDAGYGFVASMLPASMQTKIDPATGGTNYMYYAAKGALAAAVGTFGAKVMPARIAHEMAVGSFVVMMYELIRPMVAQALPSVNLGWFNPAPVQNMAAYDNTRRLAGMGAYATRGTVASVSNIKSPMAK